MPPTTESQAYQSIGSVSPEADTLFSTQKGWDGIAGDVPPSEPPIDQLQSHDFSRWNTRANRQTLGCSQAASSPTSHAAGFFAPSQDTTGVPPLSGYSSFDEPSTAATNPEPFR